jgi:hypothetical protein
LTGFIFDNLDQEYPKTRQSDHSMLETAKIVKNGSVIRSREAKNTSVARLRLSDRSFVPPIISHSARNAEAETRVARAAGRRVDRLRERIEDMALLVSRDANAGVVHIEGDEDRASRRQP